MQLYTGDKHYFQSTRHSILTFKIFWHKKQIADRQPKGNHRSSFRCFSCAHVIVQIECLKIIIWSYIYIYIYIYIYRYIYVWYIYRYRYINVGNKKEN